MREKNVEVKGKIVPWLAHHNPQRVDFNSHVIYLFDYAICLGCFAFLVGAVIGLIIGNVFYYSIVNFISFNSIFLFFLICWLPSVFQYSIQILLKKPLNNRVIKFTCRLLYPIGSIILIFKTPFWGLLISVPAGYFIKIIRNLKNRVLNEKNRETKNI